MIVRVKAIPKGKREWSDYKAPRYKNTKHTVGAYYDSYGSMTTGLTEEDAARLGEIMNKDLRPSSPFWYDYQIVIMDKDLLLDTSKPEDELKYLVLKSHFKVKKSKSDTNPYAEYEIFDELENARDTNVKAATKAKAYQLFAGLTAEQKAEILKLYPGFTKTANVLPELVESKLYEQIESNPGKFVELVEDKHRDMKIFLKDLITYDILRKNKSAYKYGTDFLGHDEESTIDYLNNPENQSLKITLMQELESRRK